MHESIGSGLLVVFHSKHNATAVETALQLWWCQDMYIEHSDMVHVAICIKAIV